MIMRLPKDKWIKDGGKTGFTLIEIMVSVTVFMVVMTASLGALLAVSDANKKAAAMRSAMDNLSFALDSMTRRIRTGAEYMCIENPNSSRVDVVSGGSHTLAPNSCPSPSQDTALAFKPADNIKASVSGSSGSGGAIQPVVYWLNAAGAITASEDGGLIFTELTSSDLEITSLRFIVVNAEGTGDEQPYVLLNIRGMVPTSVAGTEVPFDLQTTVTQRVRN